MAATFKVPIRNIFYLLSYANDLPEMIESLNEVDDDLISYDFLAEQFHREVEDVIQRGIVRSYVAEVSETSSLGGRLMLTESLPHIMRRKPVVVCEKDEYAADVLLNQMMKATLESIHWNKDVSEENRLKSYYLWEQLPEVSSIHLHRRLFYEVNLHRHNMYYKRMVHIARMLFELALLSHRQGDWSLFSVDIEDRALERLFETFLYNFYELESPDYEVGSRRMRWGLTGNRDEEFAEYVIVDKTDEASVDVAEISAEDTTEDRVGISNRNTMEMLLGNEALLPTMLTDVSLFHRYEKRIIIIDAKFYKNALNTYKGKKSFNSDNMYQMFTYLQHQPQDAEQVRGILVYPYNNDESFNEIYKWDERISLQLTTLDLRAPWEKIKAALLELVA